MRYALFALFMLVVPSAVWARDLSFEDRVACQRAIERVYYTHQIGASGPFETAVSREALEKVDET